MKKIGLIAVMSLVFVTSLGIAQVQRSNDTVTPPDETPISTTAATSSEAAGTGSPSIRGELSVLYPNLAAITREASVILVGTVLASTPRPYENVPFTVSTVTTEEVIKGTVPVGTAINVLQTGGVIAPRPAKGNATQAVTPQEFSLGGVPVMRPGERYLLFLSGPKTGPVASDVHVILGEFQGRHLIGTTGQIRFNGATGDLSDIEFAVARAVNGRLAADVLTEVRALSR